MLNRRCLLATLASALLVHAKESSHTEQLISRRKRGVIVQVGVASDWLERKPVSACAEVCAPPHPCVVYWPETLTDGLKSSPICHRPDEAITLNLIFYYEKSWMVKFIFFN